MTPKERAEFLVESMSIDFDMCRGQNIACALIAVDEILNNYCGTNTDGQQASGDEIYCDQSYWQEVKKEIQNL